MYYIAIYIICIRGGYRGFEREKQLMSYKQYKKKRQPIDFLRRFTQISIRERGEGRE